jgi:hypothetical protein
LSLAISAKDREEQQEEFSLEEVIIIFTHRLVLAAKEKEK